MDVKTLRDLDKIISLCRKKGVKTLEISGIKFELGPEEPKSRYLKSKAKTSSDQIDAPNPYSDMDIAMWSSTGVGG